MATTFDYKKVTPTMMVDYVKDNMNAEQKAAFKKAALITGKDGKKSVDKAKARKFLLENAKDITWENRPKVGTKSLASIVEEW